MKQKVIEFLATGFYSGKAPKAPGTFGTLVAIPVAYLFSMSGPIAYMALTFGLIIGAVFVCELYQAGKEEHDASEIVIDEIAGFAVTMTWIPFNWQGVVFGFLLFRFFDIVKPFPISFIDKKIKGGLGVVADDIAAGVIANILLQVVYTQTNWLGSQLVS